MEVVWCCSWWVILQIRTKSHWINITLNIFLIFIQGHLCRPPVIGPWLSVYLRQWRWRPGPPLAVLSVAGRGQSQSHPSTGSDRSSALLVAAAWLSSLWPVAPCRARTPSLSASASERRKQKSLGCKIMNRVTPWWCELPPVNVPLY